MKVGLLVPSEAATKEETVNHRLGRHGVRTLIVIRFRSPFDFPPYRDTTRSCASDPESTPSPAPAA